MLKLYPEQNTPGAQPRCDAGLGVQKWTPTHDEREIHMSTTEGTNPTTGTTNGAESEVIDLKKLDTKLVGSFKSANLSLEKIAVLIVECQEREVWLDENVTNSAGKPFKTWGAYLADRLGQYPLVNKALKGPMVAMLLEAGVSVRAAAKAADVSKSTASNINQERKGKRAARPNDGTEGTQDTEGLGTTAAQDAKKAATQAVNALKKVNDLVADMSGPDLERLVIALAESTGIVASMQELNATTVEADKDAA